MKGAGKFTILAGVLPVAAAWVAGLSGLPMAHRPVTNVLAEVLAVLLLVLGWRFRRGRLAVAALAIALANFLVRGPLVENPVGPGGSALAFLVPVTLVVLALLPERPINRPLILALLAAVAPNGTPMFIKVARGSFNAAGLWTVSGTVPPGLSGNVVTFQSFGIAPTGKVEPTNREVVTFQ